MIIILIKRKKYKIYILILLFLYNINKNKKNQKNINCENWDIGLNNTWIYNNANEYAYQINLSKSCYINILDGKLSTKKILGIDDLKRDYNQTNILFELLKISHIFRNNNNTKKIGFLKLNKGYDNLNNRKIIPITYVIINLVKNPLIQQPKKKNFFSVFI